MLKTDPMSNETYRPYEFWKGQVIRVRAFFTLDRLLALGWDCLTIPLIAIVVVAFVAEGMMLLAPGLGLRLYKLPLPLFYLLQQIEGVHRLCLAHVLALILLLTVWRAWVAVCYMTLDAEAFFKRCRSNPVIYTRFIGTLAVTIIAGDAILMYISLANQGWGWGDTFLFSFPALILTIVYVAIIITISYVTFALESRCQRND